jgi:lysophospholipase L1-like esterase
MRHIVLLGDSVFDRASFVAGEPGFVEQLREQLPKTSLVSLRAEESSLTLDVVSQLERIPEDATHLIVSVGGNDARRHLDFLGSTANSAAEVLSKLADLADKFQRDYSTMLAAARSRNLPLAVCTIYNPWYRNPLMQRLATTALAVFNNHLIYESFATGTSLLDLRLICNEEADYINPIKLSSIGGRKLAAAIAELVIADLSGKTLASIRKAG